MQYLYRQLYNNRLLPFSPSMIRYHLDLKNQHEEKMREDDIQFSKTLFWKQFGYELDLNNPITLNEKIQYFKIYDRTDLHTLCTDKFRVRKLIKKLIGEEYLIPLYYHTDDPNMIQPNNLPDVPFVVKTNHDCGTVTIVRDKRELNWSSLRKKLSEAMKNNYYEGWREWQYKNIKPHIIVEKLLLDEKGHVPTDYKFHCFNGKVGFAQTMTGRFNDLRIIFYDESWKQISCEWVRPGGTNVKKPQCLAEMTRLAEILSQPFDYVRIDFYCIEGKTFFGEITFLPAAGFSKIIPEKYDKIFGEKIEFKKL